MAKAKVWQLLLVLTLLTRAPFFGFSFLNVDEAAHWVGASELFGPGSLYSTFVDNKPPLIYFAYAPGVALGTGMLGVRILAALVLVFPTALAAAACFERRQHQLWAGALFLLMSASFVASDSQAVNTESPMLLGVAWATVLLRRRVDSRLGLLGVGALVGLASLGKQPALALLLAVALADDPLGALAWRRALGRLLWATLGVLSVGGLATLGFWLSGTLPAFWYWAVQYNLTHIGQPVPAQDLFLRALRMVGPLAAVWALPSLAAFDSKGDWPGRRLLVRGLLCTLLPAFLGGRFFGHYFLPAMFFVACLAAPTWSDWAERWPRRTLAFVLLLPAIFTGVNLYSYFPTLGVADVTFPVHREVGQRIRSDACDGSLFVWGYTPQMYYFSRRRPASRFVVPIDTVSGYLSGNDAFERGELDTKSRIVPAHRRLLMEDLERSAPSHIVDTSGGGLAFWSRFPLSSFPELDTYVSAHYEPWAAVRGMRILRRSDCTNR
jgi:hypothetical protein